MTDLTLGGMTSNLEPKSGWRARLALSFAHHRDKTRVVRSERMGPLSIQRAFYPEDEVCHSYLLHPPGGVVGGDRLEVVVEVEANAHALITTPGATKFYRSGGRLAHYHQQLKVKSKGALEWFPQENIFFPDSQLKMHTQIDLQTGARFIGWEMQCLGRPAIDERFDQGQIRSSLHLCLDGKPLLIEHFNTLNDQLQGSASGLRGYQMQATLFITPADDLLLEKVREIIQQSLDHWSHPDIQVGATRLDGLIVVRFLGYQTEALLQLMTQVWKTVRPSVMNRTACVPRIWAT